MKNKGRKHKGTTANCKGLLMGLTRSITKMASRNKSNFTKFDKKKWSKRVRGYFKSQTKDLLDPE